MSTEIRELVRLLDKDKRVLRLQENFEKLSYFTLPVEKLKSEIQTAHMGRPVRTLKPQGEFAMAIIDALAADQAVRSRLAEISIQAYRAEKSLQTALDALRNYLIVKYDAKLKIFRTKEERLRVINVVLDSYAGYFDDVVTIQNMCQIIIKDIDQASWTLKSTIEAMKMLNRPEITV